MSLLFSSPATVVWFTGAAAAGIIVYAVAMHRARVRGRGWPARRLVAAVLGCLLAAWAVWPVVRWGPEWMFTQHMLGHVLLGMAAPLLLVLARPVSLLLCALPQRGARAVTRVLDTPYMRVVTHPAVAAVLDIGGLWMLYGTGLFHAMHDEQWVEVLVHAHVFASGCLFTAVITEVEPLRRHRSFALRAVVIVAAIAAHDILAKRLYAAGDLGMSVADTQRGAMLMYYAGDAVDVVLIVLLCAGWYRRVNRPSGAVTSTRSPGTATASPSEPKPKPTSTSGSPRARPKNPTTAPANPSTTGS